MIPRSLGSTGLSVSPIGLGTVKLGRTAGLKYPRPAKLPTDAEAARLLAAAHDLGINLIDTAPAYGASEERLGNLLRAYPPGRWITATKVGEEFDPRHSSRHDFSPQAIRASIERSLSRLRVDVLDLVLVHSDGTDAAIIEAGAFDSLETLRNEGKLRAFGMSTKSVAGGLLAVERSDCAMVTCNLTARDEMPVIAHAAHLRKGILVKKPLASGTLATPDAVRDSLALVLRQPGVASAIVGTTSIAHLQACVAASEAA